MATEPMPLDWEKIGQWVYQGEDGMMISDMLSIHYNTLYERCKKDNGCEWSEWCRSKRSKGKNAVRAKMFMKAMGKKDDPLSGDVKCLLHLAKHMRGEKDNDIGTAFDNNLLQQFQQFMEFLKTSQSSLNNADNSINNEQKS